jgi:hypothetical protein
LKFIDYSCLCCSEVRRVSSGQETDDTTFIHSWILYRQIGSQCSMGAGHVKSANESRILHSRWPQKLWLTPVLIIDVILFLKTRNTKRDWNKLSSQQLVVLRMIFVAECNLQLNSKQKKNKCKRQSKADP